MALQPPADGVDVRSISNSTVSTALTSIATAAVGAQNASNGGLVEEILRELNHVADRVRDLHL